MLIYTNTETNFWAESPCVGSPSKIVEITAEQKMALLKGELGFDSGKLVEKEILTMDMLYSKILENEKEIKSLKKQLKKK